MRSVSGERVGGTTAQASATDRIRLGMRKFGSKEGLRTACDEYARGATRESLGRIVSVMTGEQPATETVFDEPAPTLLADIARAVVDGTPAGDRLIDDVVSAVRRVQDESAADGVMANTDDRVVLRFC